jgi:hypothetical protein
MISKRGPVAAAELNKAIFELASAKKLPVEFGD